MKKIINILYKILAVGLLLYALTYGLMIELPPLELLEQSSRNLFYHVPMWFTVIVLMTISVVQSVRYLRLIDPDYETSTNPLYTDAKARDATHVGSIFIVLGLVTGSIWGRVAWKAHISGNDLSIWWTNDPILICALISLLIYLAYFLLRASFTEPAQRAKVAAVYNIFAFATLIPLYFIIPRMLPGLHPTAEGSDAGGGSFIFTSGIDNSYRMILYPSVAGFILLSVWVYEVRSRLSKLQLQWEAYSAEKEYSQTQK